MRRMVSKRWMAPKLAGFLPLLMIGCFCAAQDGGKPQAPAIPTTIVTNDLSAFLPGFWTIRTGGAARAQLQAQGTLTTTIHYSGQGFEHATVSPSQPLTIPGVAQAVRIRYRSQSGGGFALKFRDGWGRTEVAGKKLEWWPPAAQTGAWQEAVWTVPAATVMPLRFDGFFVNNWGQERNARTCSFEVESLRAQTDIADVDPANGRLRGWRPEPSPKNPKQALSACPPAPLRRLLLATPEASNIFPGTEPTVTLAYSDWSAKPAPGVLRCRLLNNDGTTLWREERPHAGAGLTTWTLPLPVTRFGRYIVEATWQDNGSTALRDELALARIPTPRVLTQAQKALSPYGLNIHSGVAEGDLQSFLPPFCNAGLVWFRDYGWSYDWTVRARGKDNRFAGWPHYDRIARHALEMQIILMPCLQGGIPVPEEAGGKPVFPAFGPQRAEHLRTLFDAFPHLSHWEIDNEYNLRESAKRYEPANDWRHYGAMHKAFAALVNPAASPTESAAPSSTAGASAPRVAVQDGLAGIHPSILKACVQRGDFAGIGVVNGHHYFGTEPPETNGRNRNTGADDDTDVLSGRTFADAIRHAVTAGSSDGIRRPFWLTEFAWDTQAGHVVTPYEQAAYLQRGWLVALAAGAQRLFWFGDSDATEPAQFFDGCGLLGAAPKREPKLSLCSLAGLTHLLPAPRPIGSIEAGGGTWGYLLEQDQMLIAALWMIASDEGPALDLPGAAVHDYLANPLPAGPVRLTRAPLYAAGVSRESRWFRQTAYELQSQHVIVAAAADTVQSTLLIRNNRDTPLTCEIEIQCPAGWGGTLGGRSLTLAPGEQAERTASIRIPAGTAPGTQEAVFCVRENGEGIKRIPVGVQVRPALELRPQHLGNRPGVREIAVRVLNPCDSPREGELRLRLPPEWSATPTLQRIAPLQPGERRDYRFRIDWSAGLLTAAAEPAFVETTFGGDVIRQPLLAGLLHLHKATRPLPTDGDLGKWDDRLRLPQPGCTFGPPQTELWAAWSDEGLHMALRVRDARAVAHDPRSFWNGDCLEVFLDTADDKTHREFRPGDHQFWVVPQVDASTVSIGQWKRKAEIPQTIFNVPGARGFSRREGNGYAMEFLLPAAAIHKFRPAQGARLGLSLCLTVRGAQDTREVFWPEAKGWATTNWPKVWGSAILD